MKFNKEILKTEGQHEAYKIHRTEDGKEAIFGYNTAMKSAFMYLSGDTRIGNNVNVHLLLTTKAEESKNEMFSNQQMPQNAKFREKHKLYVC